MQTLDQLLDARTQKSDDRPVLRSANGVYRFVDQGTYADSFGEQWNEFPTVQLDHAGDPDSERRLLAETGLTPDAVRGKVVLEAGCGMGRFLEVVSRWGAELAVGIDLSSAVDACAANLGSRDNVAIAQSDIFDLPFPDGTFDIVYSIGVLHHTPDCRAAFEALVPKVAPGGTIAISLYAEVFSPGVGWAINIWRRKAQRRITKRLPRSFMFWWCKQVVPVFYRLDKVPGVRYLRYFFPVLLYPDKPVSWSILDTFDCYATEYESRHRPKEVFRWFREAGLVDINLLDSDDGWVSVSGRRPPA